jgi:hypothetical protein
VIKPSPSNAGGMGSIRGLGAKIPHASEPKTQNIKQKQYCNKFNKDCKMLKKKNKHRKRNTMTEILRKSNLIIYLEVF